MHPRSILVPAVVAALCLALAPRFALGQTADRVRREVASIQVEERLGAAVPRDAEFTDSDGRQVTFAAPSGRPVLLSFNYTGCPRLCGLQLSGIARAVRELGGTGGAFSLLTVSIDPAERPEQLRRLKATKLREAGGGAALDGAWRFAAGAKRDVDALAEAVGFRYRYDPRTNEFAHQATLIVLTGDGRVSGYLHGITYPPDALRAALDRAGAGRVASAQEQRGVAGYLLSCMGFDPRDPAPLALRVMRAGGAVALLFLVAFAGSLAVRDLRRRSRLRRDPIA